MCVVTSWWTYSKSGESRRWATFSRLPVRRLSMQTTAYPSEISRSHRWLPIKPAPPVTRARGASLATAEAPVGQAGLAGVSRVEGIAAVYEQLRLLHEGGRAPEVEVPDLLPLRDNDRRVGAFEGLVGVEDHPEVRAEPCRPLAGHGVEARRAGAAGFQGAGYLQGGRVAQAVRVRLGGGPPKGTALAPAGA